MGSITLLVYYDAFGTRHKILHTGGDQSWRATHKLISKLIGLTSTMHLENNSAKSGYNGIISKNGEKEFRKAKIVKSYQPINANGAVDQNFVRWFDRNLNEVELLGRSVTPDDTWVLHIWECIRHFVPSKWNEWIVFQMRQI